MRIFGVRNFTLNQYLGSVNYNMDRNSIFWVKNLKRARTMEFGAGFLLERVWYPGYKILDSMLGSAKKQRHGPLSVLKAWEYPLGRSVRVHQSINSDN